MEEKKQNTDSRIKRIGGYLHKAVPVMDSAGKVLSYAFTPLMVEFRPRDLMQVLVGASILAVPVAFTEETWNLGKELPLLNVALLSGLSIFFILLFVYFNFYRFQLRSHFLEYVKRAAATYLLSLIVVSIILTIIQRCPWQADFTLALKRTLIVAFPASMSAAVSDTLK